MARDLWTARRAGTQQLGGQPSPEQLSGFLCRPCDEALQHVHAMGQTALERALTVALAPERVDKLGWGNLKVTGLIGWGAVYAQALSEGEPPPRPNTEAWSHLGDLDALREQLSRTFG